MFVNSESFRKKPNKLWLLQRKKSYLKKQKISSDTQIEMVRILHS